MNLRVLKITAASAAIAVLTTACFFLNRTAPAPEPASLGAVPTAPAVPAATREDIAVQAPTPAATRTPPPRKTETPQPATATPEQGPTKEAALPTVAGMLQELDFFPGLGGGSCLSDILYDPNTQFPAASAFEWNSWIPSPESRVICLYGMPRDVPFWVELNGPDESMLAAGRFVIRLESFEQYGETKPQLHVYRVDGPDGPVLVGDGAPDEDGIEMVGIDLAWPSGMPDRGTLLVYTDDVFVETEFSNPASIKTSWLSVSAPGPLGETPLFVRNGCFEFEHGEQVSFTGGGFVPGSQVPVGVYRYDMVYGTPAPLVTSGMLPADERGMISGNVTIDPVDPAGLYYIAVRLDPSETNPFFSGIVSACFQIRGK